MSHRLDRITQRLRREGWTILQRAAAAVIAYVIALWIGDHPDVFFAPIAAIVSLNTDTGDRGFNALKLLLGVLMGIIIGELAQAVITDQIIALGVAALVAITVATVAGGERLTVAQAAAAAVLTISVAGDGSGWDRLVDALVGAGVALVFTQILFTPNPLRLLRQAETDALTALASGLHAAAQAMRLEEVSAGRAALTELRRTRDNLSDIHDARQRSRRVTRHTLTRRRSNRPVVVENENAGFLDLLGDASVMAVRLGLDGDREKQQQLSHPLQMFAELVERLAKAPGDRCSRQQVVNDVPELLDQLHSLDVHVEDSTDTATRLTRVLAHDIMRYAGVPSEEARRVMDQVATVAEVLDSGGQTGWMQKLSRGTRTAAQRVQRALRREPKDDEE